MKKLLLVLTVVAMASFLLVGCLGITPAKDEVVTIKAIPGVTPPVTGATPVAATTATAQYTGVVTWLPDDVTFAAETVYTATIKLTAKAGFTLTGVTADFFTVASATAANLVDSGIVEAEFPATAPAPVPPTKPVITTIPNQVVFWDVASWTYPVVASEGTGTITGYSLTEKPAAMSISTTGLITWSIIPDVLAVHDVTVRVDASDGEFATETFAIEVKEPVPVPVGPTVVSLLPLAATVGELYAGEVTAEPGDAAIASYALTDPPAGMTIVAATGLVTWTPATDGDQVVTVVVTDADGESGTEDFTIVVAARVAPVIAAIVDQTIPWGELFTHQVTLTAGTDLTPDYALAATRVPNAIGLAIDAETGLITWTPLEIQDGLYEVTVTATDTYDSSLFDTEVFTIVVEDPEPPEPISATIVYALTHSYNDGITQYVRGGSSVDDCVGVTVTLSEAVGDDDEIKITWDDGDGNTGFAILTGNTANLEFTGDLCFNHVGIVDCELVCVEVVLTPADLFCPSCAGIGTIIHSEIVKVDKAPPCASFIVTIADCGVCDPAGAEMSWTTLCEGDCGDVDACCDDCSGVGDWSFTLDDDECDGPCDTETEDDCAIVGAFECGCLLYEDEGDPTGIHVIDVSIMDNVGNEFTDIWTIIFDSQGVITTYDFGDATACLIGYDTDEVITSTSTYKVDYECATVCDDCSYGWGDCAGDCIDQ